MDKIQEAYKTLQAEYVRVHDLKVGDTVKCLRAMEHNECGCFGMVSGGRFPGTEMIRDIEDRSIQVYSGNWPFWCLEIVDQPRPKKIELRYFCDGKDMTDELSEKSKKALRKD